MRIISVIANAALISLAFACTSTDKMTLQASDANPAAEGVVKVRDRKDGNADLKVEVKHLAQPEKISPDSHAYVVWVQPTSGDARPQNVGVLRVDNELKGSLETNVAFEEFNVFVTAEPSPEVTSPTGDKVFTTTDVYRAH